MVENMDVKQLPQPLRSYTELIGLDNMLKLSEAAGGKKIYIPKKDCILKYFAKEHILEEYNGKNIKELAEKYNICERTIYKYITGH